MCYTLFVEEEVFPLNVLWLCMLCTAYFFAKIQPAKNRRQYTVSRGCEKIRQKFAPNGKSGILYTRDDSVNLRSPSPDVDGFLTPNVRPATSKPMSNLRLTAVSRPSMRKKNLPRCIRRIRRRVRSFLCFRASLSLPAAGLSRSADVLRPAESGIL